MKGEVVEQDGEKYVSLGYGQTCPILKGLYRFPGHLSIYTYCPDGVNIDLENGDCIGASMVKEYFILEKDYKKYVEKEEDPETESAFAPTIKTCEKGRIVEQDGKRYVSLGNGQTDPPLKTLYKLPFHVKIYTHYTAIDMINVEDGDLIGTLQECEYFISEENYKKYVENTKTIEAWLLLLEKENDVEIVHTFDSKPEFIDLEDLISGFLQQPHFKGWVSHLLLTNGKTLGVTAIDKHGEYIGGKFHLKQQSITIDL